MISKKVMKLYKDVSDANDKMIKTGENVMPICAVMKPDGENILMGMAFDNPQEKMKIKDMLKRYVAKSGCKAYILMQDSVMTVMDKKTGEHCAKDVIMRQIYTPNDKYLELVFYEDGKILKKTIMPKKDHDSFKSEWNIWETTDLECSDDDADIYNEIKRDNPERYKDVT